MIPFPFLLYLGHPKDELSVKTSRGVAVWRPDLCLGEYRSPGGTITLGLPQLGFSEAAAAGARTMIVGVANAGGVISDEMVGHILAALEAGLNVASGLHQRLSSNPAIVAAAEAKGLQLFDVREPPAHLDVGNGRPRAGYRLLTVGTDCSVGKMYTTLALERELRTRGVPADFRATGQTGIFIAQSGVPIDVVVADFISGAAESLSPQAEPGHWDVIEGQGAIFHPAYAGVTLGLLHGSQPDALVLCHDPLRTEISLFPGFPIRPLEETMATYVSLARVTNPDAHFVGISLNTSGLSDTEAKALAASLEAQHGLPVMDPLRFGVERVVDQALA